MNSKTLIYSGFLTLLLIGTVYSVFEFTSSKELKSGVVQADNHKNFATAGDVTAILYGKTTCPYCKEAMKELDRQGIKYIYKNLKKSPEALNEFAALKGNAIPLLITRNLRITGYQPQWYAKDVLNNSNLTFSVQSDNPDL